MTVSGDRNINLDLSSLFYKKLVGLEPTSDDLRGVDHFCVKSLEDIAKMVEEDGLDIQDICEEYFTTCLSNGERVELLPGGEAKMLTNENVGEYVKRVRDTRINETSS